MKALTAEMAQTLRDMGIEVEEGYEPELKELVSWLASAVLFLAQAVTEDSARIVALEAEVKDLRGQVLG